MGKKPSKETQDQFGWGGAGAGAGAGASNYMILRDEVNAAEFSGKRLPIVLENF